MNIFGLGSKPANPPAPPPEPKDAPAPSGGGSLFSGLSVKSGKTTSTSVPLPEETTPPTGSLFSFVSGGTSAAASTATPAGCNMSAFDFIDGGGSDAAAGSLSEGKPPSVASAGNLLDFPLSVAEAAPVSPPLQTQPAPPAVLEVPALDIATSGFDFMNQSTAPAEGSTVGSGSMFSFLSSDPVPAAASSFPAVSSSNTALSAQSVPPPAPDAGLADIFAAPPAHPPHPTEPIVRKKTRKFLRPGQASENNAADVSTTPATTEMAPVAEEAAEEEGESVAINSQGLELAPPSGDSATDAMQPRTSTTSTGINGGGLFGRLSVASNNPERPPPPPPRPSAEGCGLDVVKDGLKLSTDMPPGPTVHKSENVAPKIAEKPVPKHVIKPPEPPLDPKQVLEKMSDIEGVKKWYDNRSGMIVGSQKLVLDRRADCLAQLQRGEEDIVLLRKEIANVEVEQERLCEKDEFEEAELLDSKLKECREKVAKRQEQGQSAIKRAEDLAETLLKHVRERQECAELAFERTNVLRQELEEEGKFRDDDDLRKLEDRELEVTDLRAMADRMRSTAEKDSTSYEEDKQQVDQQIAEQTSTFVEARDEAQEKLNIVDCEIEKLKRLLAEKMDERVQLTENVEEQNKKIEVASSKFEKQLRRVEERRLKSERSRKKFEDGEKRVSTMVAELEQRRATYNSEKKSRRRETRDVKKEFRRLRGLRVFMTRNASVRARWAVLLAPTMQEREKSRIAADTSRQQSSKLAEKCAAYEAEAEMHRSHKEQAMSHINSLETAKTEAAKAKSFKEAGRLKEEINKHTEKTKEMEETQARVEASLAEAREQLNRIRSSEEATQSDLRKVESNSALEEIRVIRRQLRDLAKLQNMPEFPSLDESLFRQEIQFLKESQSQLAAKCKAKNVEALEEIASDEDSEQAIESASGDGEPDSPRSSPSATKDQMQEVELEETRSILPVGHSRDLETVTGDLEKTRSEKNDLEARVSNASGILHKIDADLSDAVNREDFEAAEEIESRRSALELDLMETRKAYEAASVAVAKLEVELANCLPAATRNEEAEPTVVPNETQSEISPPPPDVTAQMRDISVIEAELLDLRSKEEELEFKSGELDANAREVENKSEAAAASEDFDIAEQLESERVAVVGELEQIRKKLQDLRAKSVTLETELAEAKQHSSAPQADEPVEAEPTVVPNETQSEISPPQPDVTAQIRDISVIEAELLDLRSKEEELELKSSALDANAREVESKTATAVEREDFDIAEQLESERAAVVGELEQIRKMLQDLYAKSVTLETELAEAKQHSSATQADEPVEVVEISAVGTVAADAECSPSAFSFVSGDAPQAEVADAVEVLKQDSDAIEGAQFEGARCTSQEDVNSPVSASKFEAGDTSPADAAETVEVPKQKSDAEQVENVTRVTTDAVMEEPDVDKRDSDTLVEAVGIAQERNESEADVPTGFAFVTGEAGTAQIACTRSDGIFALTSDDSSTSSAEPPAAAPLHNPVTEGIAVVETAACETTSSLALGSEGAPRPPEHSEPDNVIVEPNGTD